MPGLQPIKILGNLLFLSKAYKLPVDFSRPHSGYQADHYGDAFAFRPEDMIGIPKLIPPWFLPAEMPNRYYQETCDEIGQNFKDFHDAMIDAVVFAHNMWKLQAKFQDLKIMAISAIGMPGCLSGPELEPLIKNAPMVAAFTGHKAKHRDAVAKGVSQCFKKWQDNVTVPGLPWYPAFAAFPGPMAPPLPNVPMPLITCVSASMPEIILPNSMKSAMDGALDGELKDKDTDKHYEGLHEAIATVLALAFIMWLPMQQVMLVMGKGPVPTFAPPYVPVGPVVGGDNIPIPGHLIS
jgi:hypothetical protein